MTEDKTKKKRKNRRQTKYEQSINDKVASNIPQVFQQDKHRSSISQNPSLGMKAKGGGAPIISLSTNSCFFFVFSFKKILFFSQELF